MPNLQRIRVQWTGPSVVGPSVSTFYAAEAAVGVNSGIHAFFDNIKASFSTETTWKVDDSGDLLDVGSGELTGTWSDSATASVTGTAATQYTLGVGCRVKWQTAGVTNGRRVTGSTFLCPIPHANFDGSGQLNNTFVGIVQTAADNLVSVHGADLRIWHRPVNGVGGAAYAISAAVVPDKVSWLRSRRT